MKNSIPDNNNDNIMFCNTNIDNIMLWLAKANLENI